MAGCSLVEIQQGVEKQSWPLAVGRTYTVGRSGAGADIEVAHATLSRKHCSILLEGALSRKLFVTVTDLGSTNGTFVNGQRLEPHASSTMRYDPQQCLGFGECKNMFKVVMGSSSGVSERAAAGSAVDGVDFAEMNRRQGLPFDYGHDRGSLRHGGQRSRSRRRSRSRGRREQQEERRLQHGEGRRREQREQKKALWLAQAATATSKPSAVSANSSGSDSDLRAPAASKLADGKPATPSTKAFATGSANAWERSSFRSVADKSKFLKLMGAKDMPIPPVGAVGGHRAQGGQQAELERQYWQGMRHQMMGRGRGLGAL